MLRSEPRKLETAKIRTLIQRIPLDGRSLEFLRYSGMEVWKAGYLDLRQRTEHSHCLQDGWTCFYLDSIYQ